MGGDPPQAPQTDYAAQSRADIDAQNNQARIDQEKEARLNAAAEAKAARDKADASAAVTAARGNAGNQLAQRYKNAMGYGQGQLATVTGGGNDYGLMAHFTQLLNNARDNVNIGSINDEGGIASAISPVDGQSIFATAQNDILTGQRQKLNTQLSNMYNSNYANEQIGDNYLDKFGQSLLDQQKADADDTIQRAYARGTLNDSGLTYAKGQLSKQGAAASGTLRGLESGIIGKYRQGLTDAVNAGQKSASNWNFGDSYDPSQTSNKITSLLASDAASGQGDLTSALGSTDLFDTATALAKAGNYMGTQSGTSGSSGTGTGTDALSSAFANAVSNNAAQKRLLGNQGIA